MLTAETKRHIDAARQVLVGVVPNPASQIDQITNALVYKFMDDMDQAAVRAGGDPSFFVGDLERYSWSRLMDPRIGNQERMNLYAEALQKFSQAKSLPELFRDIFKSAFLPYRSPETLGLFLREISYFDYAHSEELGNAYEYLLSIMASQGDAGQFRTPRHIIDFIVGIVDPKKDETVLDPACGTAGFLISAYKHILAQHDGQDDPEKKEKPLTPDERKKLLGNFQGYDIDPGMIRLAQVNMYLHQFKNPKIFGYDTLTQDERWGDRFDVVLANPPFMTPKGGIKPHSRFSIQAKRSEVLFVDYIAEHLKPNGRAGIIVPEGVIFQSQSAYKNLRKLLVEEHLVAVISLPAGCFNPYAGVKTSVLVFDRAVAKKIDSVLFAKVSNDGTDLGAKRKTVSESDLPSVLAVYRRWVSSLGKDELHHDANAISVPRERILADADCTLAAERYRSKLDSTTQIFSARKLGTLIAESTDRAKDGAYPVWSVSSARGFVSSEEFFDKKVASDDTANYKLVRPDYFAYNPSRINVGSIALNRGGGEGIVSPMYVVFSITDSTLDADYLQILLKSDELKKEFRRVAQGGVREQVRFKELAELEIPLPPPEVQKEIVAEIEGYQKVIDGARAVLGNYRPHILIDPSWQIVELGNVVRFSSGGTPTKANPSYWEGDIPWVSAKDMKSDVLSDTLMHVSESAVAETATQIAPVGTLLILVRGMGLANGVPICRPTKSCAFNQDIKAMHPDKTVNPAFLQLILKQEGPKLRRLLETAAHGTLKISTDELGKIQFPLPPLAVQEVIVTEIETERALIDSNHEIISLFEQKIQTSLARIWSKRE